jgi:hypothetical protein
MVRFPAGETTLWAPNATASLPSAVLMVMAPATKALSIESTSSPPFRSTAMLPVTPGIVTLPLATPLTVVPSRPTTTNSPGFAVPTIAMLSFALSPVIDKEPPLRAVVTAINWRGSRHSKKRARFIVRVNSRNRVLGFDHICPSHAFAKPISRKVLENKGAEDVIGGC